MQIVIDIPDRIYSIVQNKPLNIIDSGIVEKAIANGTPLPKGHGRLIDADELFVVLYKMAYMDSQPRAIRRCIKMIEKEPAIIEADVKSEVKE